MTNKYFFDTYALIELYKGNKNYQEYYNNTQAILTKLNILEFIHFLIRENKEEEIEEYLEKLNKYVIKYDDETLIETAKMKYKYRKDKVSFVDCLGYILANKNQAKFLTGDIKFKDLPNVEYKK